MSLSGRIREQLISSFRTELAEHIQTMTNGLLALEQQTVSGEQRKTTLEDTFRAAHSLKGAARAVGVTTVEQLAHALEDALDALRREGIEPTPEMFTACYQALDAIQMVQSSYEAGETTPPAQALQALSNLAPFRPSQEHHAGHINSAPPKEEPKEQEESQPERTETPADKREELPVEQRRQTLSQDDETIRVSVSKLDALMAQLGDLLASRIRAGQHLSQIRQAQELMALWQKEWLSVRSAYNRLSRRKQSMGHNPSSLLIKEEEEGAERAALSDQPLLSRAMARKVVQPWETTDADPDEWLFPAFPYRQMGQATIEASPKSGGDQQLEKDVLRLLDYVSISQERMREMNTLLNRLLRDYANDTSHTSLVVDSLEEEIKRVRMLPLNTITGAFARMVRDLAQAAGKKAVLQIVGGETELDKRVLEQIKDPLIHLLRNAVDHGIETTEQRVALGKPRSGKVVLRAEHLGKDVLLSVSDDGAGLDAEAIRRSVTRQGRVDGQRLSEAELADLIFSAGVSTSPIITDVSGRGVGLDVVRRNVEKLRGRIDVNWKSGVGTTFTLTLPLALTSSHGLLVRVSDELFAIPLNSVERIVQVRPEQVSPLEGNDTLLYRDRPITLVRLSDLLELPRSETRSDDPRLLVVILAAAEKRVAFVVDELAGEQEMVIKDLGKQLLHVGGIAGATVMGSGEVVLILNVADLIKLATGSKHRSVLEAQAERVSLQVAQARRRIMVVDDSVTTRALEKNILEAAGYAVQVATDGQEALSAIMSGSVPDLVISDIVMPHVDGFALTKRLKDDPKTSAVPVILVTSLNSPKDKVRGIEVGADAYIVKSGFDQSNLLETIEQLI